MTFELSPRWVMAIGAKYQEALPHAGARPLRLGVRRERLPVCLGHGRVRPRQRDHPTDGGGRASQPGPPEETSVRGGDRQRQGGDSGGNFAGERVVREAGGFRGKAHEEGLHGAARERRRLRVAPRRLTLSAPRQGQRDLLLGEQRAGVAKEAEERRHGSGPRAAAPVEQEPGQEAWEMAGQEPAGEAEEAEEDVIQIGGDINFERRGRSKLTSLDKVKKLKARLKELGQPRYGNKAQLWRRLEKAEKEHQRTLRKHQERQKRLREGTAEKATAPPGPQDPTPEQRAQHELTHLPPEPWCEHCVKGRAIDTAHRLVPLELRATNPRVEVDYSFVKVDGTAAEMAESSEVILSAWDEATGMATAACLPSKNYDVDYVSRWLGEFVVSLGHTKVVVRTDGEPAVLAIASVFWTPFAGTLWSECGGCGPPWRLRRDILHKAWAGSEPSPGP